MTNPRNAEAALWRNRAKSLNDRARMFQAEGHFTPSDLREIVRRDKSMCVYCSRTLEYSVAGDCTATAASFDHIIRLADGGSNTFENVVCSCRGCNQRNATQSLQDPEGAAMERLRWFLARKAQPTEATA